MLPLYWRWLKHQVCHPDAWVHVYWFPAVRSSLRVGAASVMRPGRSLAAASSDAETLRAWHQSPRDLLFQGGLRVKLNILGSVRITSHTTKAMHVQHTLPKPYMVALRDARDTVAPADTLQEAAEQLDFHHPDCGLCGTAAALLVCAARGHALVARDDPCFALLLRHMREGEWDFDPEAYWRRILSFLAQPHLTRRAVWRAMRHGGYNVSAYDKMPFRIIITMPWAMTYALLSYVRLLSLFFLAISNAVLQLRIYNKGPPHHVMSDRSIKVGSCCNTTLLRPGARR